MPFEFKKLIRAAKNSEKHYQVAEELDKWFEAGYPDPGPLEWLASIPNLKERQQVAGMLALVSAETGSHEVIEMLVKSDDRSILAGVVAPPNESGYTTAHFAVEGGHHKVIEALASSEDQAVKSTLTLRNKRGLTPGEFAVVEAQSSIIEALASAGGAAKASLSEPNPNDHLTPQARAAALGCHGVEAVLKRVTPQAPLSLPAIPQAPSPRNYQDYLRAERPEVPPLRLDQLPPLAPSPQGQRPLGGGAQASSFEEALARSRAMFQKRHEALAAARKPKPGDKGPGPGP